jgi:hypothetical protein
VANPFAIYLLTSAHDSIIPLQYVIAERLILVFRLADPSRFLEGSGFWCSLRSMDSKPAPFENRKGCGTPIKSFSAKGCATFQYFIG